MEPNHERSIVLHSETQIERTASGKSRILAAMVGEMLSFAKDCELAESGESAQTQLTTTVYKLDVSGDCVITAPTDAQIRQAVLDMIGDDGFVILWPSHDSGNTYMQASSEDGLVLEYQERDTSHHFRAIGDVDADKIIAALSHYRNGDGHWRSVMRWERMDL